MVLCLSKYKLPQNFLQKKIKEFIEFLQHHRSLCQILCLIRLCRRFFFCIFKYINRTIAVNMEPFPLEMNVYFALTFRDVFFLLLGSISP